MSDMSDLKCASCSDPLERIRYFPRQLLTADDMRVEQEYFREKMRRHNRYLVGWGVVCGFEVEPISGAGGSTVRVCPGYALGPQGDEILLGNAMDVDLQFGAREPPCSVRWPCPPIGDAPAAGKDEDASLYVAIRYAECYSRPVRVHPQGCGCDETNCEYSRIRDSFEIKVLRALPESHQRAARDDQQWCDVVNGTPAELLRRLHTFPAPPCPECEADPWVVLATVTLPKPDNASAQKPRPLQISYKDRRVVLAVQRLQTAVLCLPEAASRRSKR